MPDPLPVHVSRSELHAVETVESYETTGPFAVELTNHGRDAHVHLKLDDALAAVATQDGDGNYYVERDGTRRVHVDVDPVDAPVEGSIAVETGYGAERVVVGVTVRPADGGTSVAVGEDLATPPEESPGEESEDGEAGRSLPSPSPPEGALPVAALAVVALAIAGLAAATVESVVVVAGVVVVLAGVLAAAVMLVK